MIGLAHSGGVECIKIVRVLKCARELTLLYRARVRCLYNVITSRLFNV